MKKREKAGRAILRLGECKGLDLPALPRFSWQPGWVDRFDSGVRPGAHPLHEQGAYYILDPSSVFAISPLIFLGDNIPRSPRVLDLCSAPGGKGIFAWRALQPELIVCNEVIGKRTGMLLSNLKRCNIRPAVATSSDSAVFAEHARSAFDVVIVDAPCSGQSLPVKGEDAPGCFNPRLIKKCAMRQRRIMVNACKCVAPGGYLLYMTCTYAVEENEEIITWVKERFPEFVSVEISELARYRSILNEDPAYRLWPFEGEGAGAFVSVLKRNTTGDKSSFPVDKFSLVREFL